MSTVVENIIPKLIRFNGGAGKMIKTGQSKKELKSEFIKNRGYWNDFWEDILELDDNFFAASAPIPVPAAIKTATFLILPSIMNPYTDLEIKKTIISFIKYR